MLTTLWSISALQNCVNFPFFFFFFFFYVLPPQDVQLHNRIGLAYPRPSKSTTVNQ